MAIITTKVIGGDDIIVGGAQLPGLYLLPFELDLSDPAVRAASSGDQIKLLDVPADTYFKLVQVENATAIAMGGNEQIDIGDATDDDEFVAAATTLTAGTNHTIAKTTFTDSTAGDTVTTASDFLVKLTGDDLTGATGTIRFVALVGNTARKALAVSPIPDSAT